jgi:hypothetical protein
MSRLLALSALTLLNIFTRVSGFTIQASRNSIRSQPQRWATSDSEVQRLLNEADRLRQEVAAFQRQKSEVENRTIAMQLQAQETKQQTRNRYSADVPIFKEDGSTKVERVDFPPFCQDGSSRIVVVEASLPIAILLGESEEFPGSFCIDEVAAGGNGARAGVIEGDLLRACTACQTIMDAPTWQILAGGIGMPKTKIYVYSADGRPFEEVMGALGSNRMDPNQRPVLLVLERRGV